MAGLGEAHAHSPGSRLRDELPEMLLGGAFAGAIAFGAIVYAQQEDLKYVIAVVATVITLIALPLIRNLRLFCFYMIFMLAPLGLKLSFLQFPHIGGAAAFYVEVVDPFLGLLLFFQLREWMQGRRERFRFPRPLQLWAGMILLGLGSVLFMSVLRITAANELARMVKLFLLAWLLTNEMVTRKHLKHAVIAITLGLILQSSVALLQYVRGAQLGLAFLGESTDDEIKALSDATLLTGAFVYRVGGLLGHANLFAGYLALFLPMCVGLLLAPVSKRLKALLAVALLLGQPALVLTLSRTGWIDFSIALMMVLVLGAVHPVSRRRFFLVRVIIIATTVTVALALSPKIIQRLYETDPNAVEFRIKWIKTARAMILDNPVFGTGLNTYVYAQLPYGEDKTPLEMSNRYGKVWPVVHNSWLLTWSEQGTLGFILFVWIHLSVIVIAVKNLKIRDPMMHAISVGLLAGVIAIMVDGLASFFIRQEATGRMFWIAIAMILAIAYWRRANEEIDPAMAASLAAPEPPPGTGAIPTGRWLPARESVLR